MSYKIIYGTHEVEYSWSQNSKKKRKINIVTAVIAILLVFILSGRVLTREEREVAAAAIDHFAENIAEGEGIGDAITAFCQEIIESANSVE